MAFINALLFGAGGLSWNPAPAPSSCVASGPEVGWAQNCLRDTSEKTKNASYQGGWANPPACCF